MDSKAHIRELNRVIWAQGGWSSVLKDILGIGISF